MYSHVFRFKNFNPISKDPNNSENNIIILNYNSDQKLQFKKFIEELDKSITLISSQSCVVELKYNNFNLAEVLKMCLPNDLYVEFPKSFEMIGTIAHVTLREKFLKYKKLIGNLILDVSKINYLILN